MYPTRMTFHGFGSFAKKSTLEFHPNQVTYIVGTNKDTPGADQNAAGKTTVLDMIAWAIRGTTPTGMSKDDLISHSKQKVGVHLEFDTGFEVLREKERGRGETLHYRFSPQDEWMSEGVVRTQIDLDQRVFGITKDVFFNAIYLSQSSGVSELLRTTPAERAKILRSLVNSEPFKKALVLIKEDLKSAQTQAQFLRTQVANKKEALEESSRDLHLARQALEDEVKTHSTHRAKVAQEITDLTVEMRRLKGLASQVSGFSIEEIQQRLATVQSTVAELTRQQTEAEYEARAALLPVGAPCPTCHQPVEESHYQTLAKKITAAQMRAKKYRTMLVTQTQARDNLQANLERARKVQVEREFAKKGLAQLQARVAQLQDQLHPYQSGYLRERVQEMEEKVKKRRGELATLEKKLLEVEKDILPLEELIPPFRRGIEDMLFDQVRVALTTYANSYARTYFGSGYKIDCPVTEKDEFIIRAHYNGTAQDIMRFSTGERFRLNMSVAQAFGRMLLASQTCPFRFRMIDEFGEGLDPKGRETLNEVAHHLVESGETDMLLVTLPRKDLAVGHRTLHVVKERGESRVFYE